MDKGRVSWLGITGGIATGKSTACAYLIKKSIPVIDADKISHRLLLAESPAIAPIVKTFGEAVLNKDGSISRPNLGAIVFKNKKKLSELNSIMHPLVREKTEELKNKLISEGHKLIVNDVPLLFENNLQASYDKTILIYCDESTQKKRLKNRDQFSDEEIDNRLSSQLSIESKKEMADVVIDNSGSLASLYTQLDELIG